MSNSNQNENTQGAAPNVPACLQPGGELDKILESSSNSAMGRQFSRTLHMQLCRDVENLRYEWNSPGLGSQVDVVLRHCIEKREGNDHFETEAQQKYRQYAGDYDRVLGDFIPEDLRRWARASLARQAYVENNNATAADDWAVFTEMQQRSGQDGLLGLPTGLTKLDEMLGGLRGLIFLGGDKGTGKTSLALFMVLAALRARTDVAVLFYSLDMAKTRIYERLLCCEAGVAYRTLSNPQKSAEQEELLAEADERLQQEILPRLRVIERDFSFEVVDSEEGQTVVRNGITHRGIIEDCRDLMKATGANQILIVVDLFQKMDPHGDIADGAATDHYRLDGLDQVQKHSCGPIRPHGFPILVTSEIRKDATKNNLTRDDLKGSGRIASDADVVLLMWPEDTNHNTAEDVVPTTLRIGKGREGVVRTDVKLWFEHPSFRFHDEKPLTSTSKIVPENKKSPSGDGSHQNIDPLGE